MVRQFAIWGACKRNMFSEIWASDMADTTLTGTLTFIMKNATANACKSEFFDGSYNNHLQRLLEQICGLYLCYFV